MDGTFNFIRSEAIFEPFIHCEKRRNWKFFVYSTHSNQKLFTLNRPCLNIGSLSFTSFRPFSFLLYPFKTVEQESKLKKLKFLRKRKPNHITTINGLMIHTYGVKILTHRVFFSPFWYWKLKDIPSSSTSHCFIVVQGNSITWD